jgi:hypothetical protein
MSVARMRTRAAATDWPNVSRQTMAVVYGSSPLEHPALQMRIGPLRAARAGRI